MGNKLDYHATTYHHQLKLGEKKCLREFESGKSIRVTQVLHSVVKAASENHCNNAYKTRKYTRSIKIHFRS